LLIAEELANSENENNCDQNDNSNTNENTEKKFRHDLRTTPQPKRSKSAMMA
jgi:hypothetical protein